MQAETKRAGKGERNGGAPAELQTVDLYDAISELSLAQVLRIAALVAPKRNER